MRMTEAEKNKFINQITRSRNAIERKGYSLARKALIDQYQSFLNLSVNYPPEQWETIAKAISEQPIRNFMQRFYPLNARIGLIQRKNLNNQQKDFEDDQYFISIYQKYLLSILDGQSGDSIRTITATSRDKVIQIIRRTLKDAEIGGYGIEKLRQELQKNIGASLRGNVRSRARAIAQTEMIKASNQAQEYAVKQTGFDYRKFWVTSHLENTRPTHWAAEQESKEKGGLIKDQRFLNGLLYPGDPAGPAEEIINCRCILIYESVLAGTNR